MKRLFGKGIVKLLVLSFATQAFAVSYEKSPSPAHVRTYEASETTSQYIRDNAPDYWRWSKSHADKYFGSLIKYEGIVIGDAHPGNFIFSPLAGKMRLFIMDIKDAGRGPFIIDIAREIMAANSIFKDGEEDLEKSIGRQLDAYIEGLKKHDFQPHENIEWIFETQKKDFDKEVEKYIAKQAVGSEFRLKEGMIEPLRDYIKDETTRDKFKKAIRAAVSKQLPGSFVQDFAFRPRERGGSKNLKRYWALVETKEGQQIIFEFKEIDSPAVAQYEQQLPALSRFDKVMDTLWGVRDSQYQAVMLEGKPHWMRPKKIDVFDIPYKQKQDEDRKFVRHLAAYVAYLMGRYHGKQLDSKAYVDKLEANRDQIIKALGEMSEDYVSRLESKVKELQQNDIYE